MEIREISAACETWNLTERQYCGRHDIIFLRAGEGELHTFSAFKNNVKRCTKFCKHFA